jgi:hypothetical protein
MRYNPNAMMVDGGGGVPNNPTLTPAQMQTATRKLGAGQPLTDAEKIALGLPISVSAAAQVSEVLSGPVGEDDPRYYTVKVGTTGKTSAQLAAFENATNTASMINELYGTQGIKSTIDPVTGKIVTTKTTTTTPVVTPTPIVTPTPVVPQTIINNVTDPAVLALIQSLQSQIANLSSANNSAAALAAADKKAAAATERKNAIDVLTERFKRYGLGSLVNKIKDLAIDGATEATITLGLQETEEYKTRFKANQARIAKGLAVLNPAEYLNVEDGYRQVLRAYGLKQFDTDDYVSQFIANDVSATELSNRVVTAVQRVQNADPAISQQLRDFYGIGQADLVAYVLDPNQQFQKIERQVAASEIGVAAARQGLKTGVSVAEQLAAQGVTQAEAQKGYATIADILPTAEKLSDIYGTTLEGYGQTEAEQEVFNSLASAQRKRQKLTQREIASFSGAAGVNKTSLTTSNVGQY